LDKIQEKETMIASNICFKPRALFALATLAVILLAGLVSRAAEPVKTVPNPALAQKNAPKVKVAPAGWALQGRVYNAQLQPVAGFSVFFVDASGKYLPQYGFAYTDSTGYFLLNYAGSNGHAPAAQQLFIEVANTSATPVYHSSTPFQPVYGTATYQSITLPNTVRMLPNALPLKTPR
jgi:hypothetical protein